MTTTYLARAAGLAPSTLNRFVNGTAQKNLGGSTIGALIGAIAQLEAISQLSWQTATVENNPYPLPISVNVIGQFHQEIKLEDAFYDDEKMFELKIPVKGNVEGICAFQIKDALYGFEAEEIMVCRQLDAESVPNVGIGAALLCLIDNGESSAILRVMYFHKHGEIAYLYPHQSESVASPIALGSENDLPDGILVGFEVIGKLPIVG